MEAGLTGSLWAPPLKQPHCSGFLSCIFMGRVNTEYPGPESFLPLEGKGPLYKWDASWLVSLPEEHARKAPRKHVNTLL